MRIVRDIRGKIHQYRLVRKWKANGRQESPPHLVKEKTLRDYAKRFSIEVLIETGTFMGDMVYANKNRFRKIVSIELDPVLYEQAKVRFRNNSHIEIVHGDSSTVLPKILKDEGARCLFWLDGHYSGGNTARGERETPVMEELRHIKSSGNNHIILIDDARLFQGTHDYPTLDALKSFASELWPGTVCDVRDDIIRIHPRE